MASVMALARSIGLLALCSTTSSHQRSGSSKPAASASRPIGSTFPLGPSSPIELAAGRSKNRACAPFSSA